MSSLTLNNTSQPLAQTQPKDMRRPCHHYLQEQQAITLLTQPFPTQPNSTQPPDQVIETLPHLQKQT